MSAIFDPGHFFDHIYCISIVGRSDRREMARRQFEKLGIADRVEFHLVEKNHENPEKGIFLSHMECLRKGLDAAGGHILVFEDDFIIDRFQENRVNRSIEVLGKIRDWDGFFLGAITRGVTRTEFSCLNRINYSCLAHAYGLNRAFARKIIREQWTGIPFDQLLQDRCVNGYAPSPMIAFQSGSASDNRTIRLDRTRRLFGGLRFLQMADELYQNHKMLIIVSHLCLLLLMFLIII